MAKISTLTGEVEESTLVKVVLHERVPCGLSQTTTYYSPNWVTKRIPLFAVKWLPASWRGKLVRQDITIVVKRGLSAFGKGKI